MSPSLVRITEIYDITYQKHDLKLMLFASKHKIKDCTHAAIRSVDDVSCVISSISQKGDLDSHYIFPSCYMENHTGLCLYLKEIKS